MLGRGENGLETERGENGEICVKGDVWRGPGLTDGQKMHFYWDKKSAFASMH